MRWGKKYILGVVMTMCPRKMVPPELDKKVFLFKVSDCLPFAQNVLRHPKARGDGGLSTRESDKTSESTLSLSPAIEQESVRNALGEKDFLPDP